MIDTNTSLNRFGIYYLPRKNLEDGLSNKIKRLKKLRSKYIKEGKDVKNIDSDLKLMNSNRPCVIFQIYKKNVYIMPITKSDADESHIATTVFNREFNSFIKTSVIITMGIDRFKDLAERLGNKKLNRDEINKLLESSKKHYFE